MLMAKIYQDETSTSHNIYKREDKHINNVNNIYVDFPK